MDLVDLGLVLVHTASLAGAAVALGAPAVLGLAILPAARALDRGRTLDARLALLQRNALRLVVVAILVEAVCGVVWLLFEAASMSGQPIAQAARPAILGATLWQTNFGVVLLVRLALIALALPLVALLARTDDRSRQIDGALLLALAGAGGIAANAWAGHAVATPGLTHLIADALHLIAAGIWLGGLAALALLFASPRTESAESRRGLAAWVAIVAGATRRFSPIGIACVGTLLASGSISTWYLVGTVPALIGTPYGQLLMVKLALAAAMVALAAVNRQRLTPRLATPSAAAAALAQLRRNTLAEAAFGLAVLAIVAALGTVPPGLHDQPWWPLSWRFSLEAMALPAVANEITVAAGITILGIVLCAVGLVRRRYRLLALSLGLALIAIFAPSFRLLAVVAYPTSFTASPVAYTTTAIAAGRRLFAENCVGCHGAEGRGDGPDGKGMAVPPADLTQEHVFAHSEGDLFWWVSAGIPQSGMPGFGDALSEEERWELLAFVRTLPAGGLGEGLADEVGTGPAPRAPDFTFTMADRAEGSLQGLLNSGPVLLVFFTPADDQKRLRRLVDAAARLAAAGLQLLALPLDPAEGEGGAWPPFVARASAECAAIYRILASNPRYKLPLTARHLEFLIDRQGYVRALWLPQETAAWSEVGSLVALTRQLAERPLAPPRAGVHIH